MPSPCLGRTGGPAWSQCRRQHRFSCSCGGVCRRVSAPRRVAPVWQCLDWLFAAARMFRDEVHMDPVLDIAVVTRRNHDTCPCCRCAQTGNQPAMCKGRETSCARDPLLISVPDHLLSDAASWLHDMQCPACNLPRVQIMQPMGGILIISMPLFPNFAVAMAVCNELHGKCPSSDF